MSGKGKNKRQRTVSSLKDGRTEKRHRTDNKNERADIQGTTHGQSASTSSVNGETTKEDSSDAKGGRSFRLRTEVSLHSEGEDDPADESWTPGAGVMNVQKSSISTKRRKLENFFQCTDQCMEEFFADIGIVLYFENPPPPIPCAKVHEHTKKCVQNIPSRVVASNVTQELLAFYAAWVFANANSLGQQETSTNTAANIYKPIVLIASPITWNVAPFIAPTKQEDGTFKLGKDEKPDRDIRAAWWWFRRRLMDGLLLKIPLEWTYTDESVPSDRPEMPDTFWKLLREEEPVSRPPQSTCSSLDGTPLKKSASTSLANAPTVKPLSLGTIQEQDESSSPLFDDKVVAETSQLASESSASATPTPCLPYFDLEGMLSSRASGTKAQIKHYGSETTEPSDLPAPPAALSSLSPEKFELAYSLIKKHGLKETKEDALRLERYLADGRHKFDINQSKQLLCSILGPAEKHTILDGDFTNQGFAYVPRAEIEKADELDRCGNAGRTENAVDIDDTAMELNYRWLSFRGIDKTSMKGKQGLSELDIERKVGRLFVGLFRFDELQESSNQTTRFLEHFQLFRTSPRPDYAVRPAPGEWSHWPDTLRPIMASVDMKTPESMCNDNSAQLAFNTRALITLQILMYLDTRQDASAPLPGWMFNLSWIANHQGFTVYAHYPSIKLAKDGKSWSWKMVSVMLTDIFYNVWEADSSMKRQQAKAAFDMIVSHTCFSLAQIRNWSQERGCYGEGSIMNRLIARAHLEEGNYEWLYRKMEEVKKEVKEKQETATESNL